MLWRILYNALAWTIVLPMLCVPRWRRGLGQRLGLDLRKLPKASEQPTIWVHAVSYGEVQTARPLLVALSEAFAGHRICLSVGTATGYDLACKVLSAAQVFYFPVDFYTCVQAHLEVVKPDFVCIIETELWPEFLWACREQAIPVFLLNARVTERSSKLYALFRPVFADLLSSFRFICAQSQADAERYLALGCPREKIRQTENLKLDSLKKASPQNQAALQKSLGLDPDDIILLFASTHQGEEELALALFRSLSIKQEGKPIKLIIAPRHPERVESLLPLFAGLKLARRSATSEINPHWEVLILDTLGELGLFYSLASIAYLGGTWAAVGGHNPLEATAYGIPLFVGSQTYKIEEMLALIAPAGFLFRAEHLADMILQSQSLIAENKTGQQYNLAPQEPVAAQLVKYIQEAIL